MKGKFGYHANKFLNHSIQMKIIAVSLLIAVGTTFVSLVISYYAEIDTIKSTTRKYMQQYISFADQEFNTMLEESKKIIVSVAAAQEFISPNIVEEGQEASYKSYLRRKQINGFLSGFMSQKEYIDNIMLITQSKQIYQATADIIVKKELNEPIMKRVFDSQNMELIYDSNTKTLLLCRNVKFSKNNIKATIIIQLNYDYMTSVYNIEQLKPMALYLYQPDGRLFYTNVSIQGDERGIYKQLKSSSQSEGYVDFGKEKKYYIIYSYESSQMILISLIPQSILLKDIQKLKYKFMLIGTAASAAAVLAAVYLSKKICSNLKCLCDGMEAVRSGDLSIRMEFNNMDEIGVLSDTFNIMMERIEQLIEEVKIKEKLKREAEQDILASQIEPHFLYNSIDSIQYVAHMRGEIEIKEVAKALSELLRSVLSNHNEFITLWEEKDYIDNYIAILQFKYRRPFVVIWDVEEGLWVYPIPKLLLQPVVENALIHGISIMHENGIIHIKIFSEQGEVICKVMDNGKGMSEEKINLLMTDMSQKAVCSFRHIGISNVFNRIHLIYGEPYGGRIYSCENVFTCVELHLPMGGEEDGFKSFAG